MRHLPHSIVALLLFVTPAGALPPDRGRALDRAVLAELARQDAVGLAVGVVEGGEVVYVSGFGYADRDLSEPVTPGTLFRWASCSKPLTAVAAMQLVDGRKLDLDADVRTLVPEFPDKGVRITPRQLLCHQGGIVHYTNGRVVRTKREYPMPYPYRDVVLALDKFKESPLVARPGERYSYTTHGYVLLSAVVERAGQQPFADQVRDRIARPLGMTTLRPDYQWEDISGRAKGYRKVRGEIVPSLDADVSWKLGGGGYLSSVKDFARFARGLLRRELLSEKAEAVVWAPQRLAGGQPTTYGLGFNVDGAGEGLRVAHSGAQEKTRTRMVLYPRRHSAVVVMTNCEWVNPGQVATAVFAALTGK
ncbi:MAG: serine hydrolase domain-containing protein [Gemmataceae bacterium]